MLNVIMLNVISVMLSVVAPFIYLFIVTCKLHEKYFYNSEPKRVLP
jgi:hypothetical protein